MLLNNLEERLINWEIVYKEDSDKPEGSLYLEAVEAIRQLKKELLATQCRYSELAMETEDLNYKLAGVVDLTFQCLNCIAEVQAYEQPDDPWEENALTMHELDIFNFDQAQARRNLIKLLKESNDYV